MVYLFGLFPDKTVIQKDTYNPYVHRSTTHNSQDMGTAERSTDR